MKFNDYQEKTATTAIYPEIGGRKYIYPILGLIGEAGEVAGKVKKIFRDDDGVFTDEVKEKISGELGDVLWYVAQVATTFGYDLEDMVNTYLDDLDYDLPDLLQTFEECQEVVTKDERAIETYIEETGVVDAAFSLATDAVRILKAISIDDKGNSIEWSGNERKHLAAKSLGGCVELIALMAAAFELNIGEISQANLDKLQSRKERNVIKGDGDNR